MTNEYAVPSERRNAFAVGSASSEIFIYQLGMNSHPPDGASSYLWAQQTGVCAVCITTACSTVDLCESQLGGLCNPRPVSLWDTCAW